MFFEVSAKCTAPFGRDLLIDAARRRARGISWEVIAKDTPHSAGELCRFTVKHPEAWRPLYVRAEKLRLQEAEGRTLAHLTALLKGKDETAAEQAARELLVHRRHVERRRYRPRRRGDTEKEELLTAAGVSGNTGVVTRDQESFSVPLCLRGENDPPPEELETALLAAARGFALGEETGAVARETGRSQEEIARWAFIYAKAWDRAWRPARLEAAEFGAALAINRLLDFAAGPDAALAARAARTLLVHRRHMHWGSARGDMRLPEWHPACPTGGDSLDETTPGGRKLTICQGGQKTSFSGKTQNGERFEGAGTYPPSLTRVSVAIGGDGSLTVAPGFAEATPDKRRSGPPRSCGAVRPSAWPRDGPG